MYAGRLSCEDGGRDGGDTSTNRGSPKMASMSPEVEGWRDSEATNPINALILDFWLLEL